MSIAINHQPGRHCASTALSNLCHHHGLRWSEAFCFGLGGGLGFWFINIPGASPSRFIHVRSADLEEQFFKQIGQPLTAAKFDHPEEGEKALCSMLDRGNPVLVLTDLYYLPYFNSKTHFPGHAVTVWSYDREARHFHVTDTEREEIFEVSFEQMRQARFGRGLFSNLEGNCFTPEKLENPGHIPAVIRNALAANSRMMVESSTGFQGVEALARWGERIEGWCKLPDWQWAARFCYQVIEKRGTGGGGFRLLYADFLREAAGYLPETVSTGLDRKMQDTGEAWRALAFALKEASERDKPDFGDVSQQIARVYDLEAAYHRKVLEVFK